MDMNYTYFRLCVNRTDVQRIMSPDFWPHNISVRGYIWEVKVAANKIAEHIVINIQD